MTGWGGTGRGHLPGEGKLLHVLAIPGIGAPESRLVTGRGDELSGFELTIACGELGVA